ncbi:MAG: 4Fe-4S dicluster domain-containing protein [Chitinivibrionales bacterium]|nr:4Fe-4S dicluster domain-containing protein [Chitinivibrionales bacterium]MBD3357277.1 4Fe-4S dicluster domain-containing protein [Chitinivibrionales bacterium]
MKRKIISIDHEKCTGCGLCIPDCPEGAIQMVDGKARLVSDLFCDGLGACLGTCPEGAISIEEREAEAYNEKKVMANIVLQGENTIRAHLKHLREHNEEEYLQQALEYLRENDITVEPESKEAKMEKQPFSGCPGSRTRTLNEKGTATHAPEGTRESQLTHWPIQMHLISPRASHYQSADLLLAADCVAYTAGDFHKDFLRGKTLAIACPKLDEGQEIYKDKLKALIDEAKINTLTVLIMQVPCCGGLLRLAQQAAAECKRKVPIKAIVVSLEGAVIQEEWV